MARKVSCKTSPMAAPWPRRRRLEPASTSAVWSRTATRNIGNDDRPGWYPVPDLLRRGLGLTGTNTCGIIAFNTTASGSVTPGTNAALRSDGSFIVAASAGAVTSPGAHGLYVSGSDLNYPGLFRSEPSHRWRDDRGQRGLSNNFTVTIAGNRTLSNPSNLVAGQILNFQITQDATGDRTLAFGANYNGAISLNPAANAVTMFSCYASSSSSLQCAGVVPRRVLRHRIVRAERRPPFAARRGPAASPCRPGRRPLSSSTARWSPRTARSS